MNEQVIEADMDHGWLHTAQHKP